MARFVAGDQVVDAVHVAERLSQQNLDTTVAWVGEGALDRAAAMAARATYLELIRGLSAGGRSRETDLSVKLSALGLRIPNEGAALAQKNVEAICHVATEHQMTVTIDMEEHSLVDLTLTIVQKLRRDFPDVGCVLQANLRRTESDCSYLAAENARIRLCKGAYSPPPDMAYSTHAQIVSSYVRCIQRLHQGGVYVMVASHDPRLIDAARNTLQNGQRSFEYQMLMGVRDDEKLRLRGMGHRVRVYVPFGSEWFRYFSRRLAEHPSNVLLLGRALLSRTSVRRPT